jgi:5'-methylthioadenosine phosphorylase
MQVVTQIGIIGGSGLYNMPDLENTQEIVMDTPFGKPSAPIFVGSLDGVRVAFLARHGIGHVISPTEINYRANIYAFKSLGVREIVSVSACGSLREDYAPGDIVIPDQLFDYTQQRPRSFFGNGFVAHVSVAEPFCSTLSGQLLEAIRATGARVHSGGSFITVEGPRFSTRAESNVYRAWGMSIIGMTTSPEAFLAREAELCYTVMGHVTDYDVWHVTEEPVSVEMVIRILNQNTAIAQQAIAQFVKKHKPNEDCECRHALEDALITNPQLVPQDTRQNLSLLVDKYLNQPE